jgi:hypothetical protein
VFVVEEPAVSAPKSWITETVILSAVPVIAYAMAFAYEKGFAEYYGYPDWLIEVNLQSVLIMASVLFIVAIFVGVLLLFFAAALPARPTRIIVRSFGPYCGALLFVAGAGFMLYELENGKVATQNVWLIVGAIAVLLVLLAYAIFHPLVSKKYTGSPLRRWEKARESWKGTREGISAARPDSVSILDDLQRSYRLLPWLGLAAFVSTIAVGIMMTMSHLQARLRSVYLVTDTRPPLVALRGNGDRIIAGYLGTDSTLQPSFRILPMGGEQPITWTLKAIGPLRVKRPPLGERSGSE